MAYCFSSSQILFLITNNLLLFFPKTNSYNSYEEVNCFCSVSDPNSGNFIESTRGRVESERIRPFGFRTGDRLLRVREIAGLRPDDYRDLLLS